MPPTDPLHVHRSAYARVRRSCHSDMEQLASRRCKIISSRRRWRLKVRQYRSQLAVFLHDKHTRTSDPLGNPREMKEPDSLGG